MQKDYIQVDDPSNLPKDSISCARWSHSAGSAFFMVSSWDGTFRIYEVTPSHFKQIYLIEREFSITSFVMHSSNTHFFLGYVNGQVSEIDYKTTQETIMGTHSYSVRSLFYLEKENVLCSFDIGNCLKVFDKTSGSMFELHFEYRIFCVDYRAPYFVVIFSQDKLSVFEFSAIKSKIIHYHSHSLNSPISVVQIHEKNYEALFGTYDGKIGRLMFGSAYGQPRVELILRPHETPYPHNTALGMFHQVNSLTYCYLNGLNSYITGGGDGKICFGDYTMKSKYRTQIFDMPVVEVCIHREYSLLLVCLGYDWGQGIWGLDKVGYSPKIVVCQLTMEDFARV